MPPPFMPPPLCPTTLPPPLCRRPTGRTMNDMTTTNNNDNKTVTTTTTTTTTLTSRQDHFAEPHPEIAGPRPSLRDHRERVRRRGRG